MKSTRKSSRKASMPAAKLSKLWLSHYIYGDDRRAAWLVVRDPCAGVRGVYTVYRISLTGVKQAQVIGRELPLPLARKVVKRDMETIHEVRYGIPPLKEKP